MVKDCHNCEHHTWGDEWWNCQTECNKCKYTDMQGEKVPSNWKPLPMTNADRIRAMTDEELAEFICLSPEMEFDVCRFCQYGNPTPMDDRGECLYDMGRCYAVARAEAMKKWLQQPAEGD